MNSENKQWQPYEDAEKRILDNHEQEVSRRLSKAAWRSLGYDISSNNDYQTREKSQNSDTENQNNDSAPEHKKIMLSDIVKLNRINQGLSESSENVGEESNSEPDTIETIVRKYMQQELLKNGHDYHRFSREQDSIDFSYRLLTPKDYEGNRGLDNMSRQVQAQIERLTQSPEGYYVVRGNELRTHAEEIRNGGIAITPYVKKNLDTLEKNMTAGLPTFIYGHLGSGKTELAIMAAKRSSIKRAAFEEAYSDLEQYMNENPDRDEDDYFAYAGKSYRRNIEKLNKAAKNGESETFGPLMISGSKDMTTQDLFVDKTLKLTKYNSKTILEHKQAIDDEFEKWKLDNPADADDPNKAKAAAAQILEFYKLENQAFGTEVEIIKNAVYEGALEGRPVIIDEANAIPAAILISMNDLLGARPGDIRDIPHAGKTKIQPGFSITITGNISTKNVLYEGTNELNPAFRSRYHYLEYDYLPMSESDRSYKEQANPEDNELFQVIIYSLVDRQGNLVLPEMDKSLEKIFALSQLSHKVQRIFSDKWQESEARPKTVSGDELEPELNETVLSMRNILRIIDEWEKGRAGDLDKALWDGYIQGITDADERNLTLALAKECGFFQDSDGWHVEVKRRGSGASTFSDIYPGKYQYTPKDFETRSYRKVLEVLYGPAPEREAYPDDLELEDLASLGDNEVNLEDLELFEKVKQEISDTIAALEVLGAQCGCDIKNDDNIEG